MEIIFPCGAKGSPDYCPEKCQYGKFCKIKDQKKDPKPRGLQEEEQAEDIKEEDFKIEIY